MPPTEIQIDARAAYFVAAVVGIVLNWTGYAMVAEHGSSWIAACVTSAGLAATFGAGFLAGWVVTLGRGRAR